MQILSEGIEFLVLTITAGQTGRVKPTEPLKLKADGRLRYVAITSTTHEKSTKISLQVGRHRLINNMPDIQAFESSPHTSPETAPSITSYDEILAEAIVTTPYAADTDIVIAVAYWIMG